VHSIDGMHRLMSPRVGYGYSTWTAFAAGCAYAKAGFKLQRAR
jgi:hypothetical protein